MCGIAGIIDFSSAGSEVGVLAGRMADALTHRGPDSGGVWSEHGVALAHRRLAIIDLSPAGHQPMVSRQGRFVIVFNGEIYNFREIRKDLEAEGEVFSGGSDTEVLLTAIECWGVAKSLARATGMFAFALWDRHERTLLLARDRLGEKPLYWATDGQRLAFGSELRALRLVPGICGSVDMGSVNAFLRHSYVPTPRTIFDNARKLPAATAMRVKFDASGRVLRCDQEAYWSVDDAYKSGRERPFQGSLRDAADELEVLLRRVITNQMVSDVPIGAFLSGGIDSSTVVALMQSVAERPVRTFTIGFEEQGFDEASNAEEVAKHLGTQHLTMYVSPGQALDVIPRMPEIYDEPFADSSQIPTYLLSALTRDHVTVALSGDGGDELFCGYNRYLWARSAWRVMSVVPAPARLRLASLLRRIPPSRWDHLLSPVMKFLPGKFRVAHVGEKLAKLGFFFDIPDPRGMYLRFLSHWHEPSEIAEGGVEPKTEMASIPQVDTIDAFTRHMMKVDSKNYLADDIMVKVDRAGMAVSLEGRVPFLDHHIFEFAARLPIEFLLKGREGKRVLREVLYRHVPKPLVDRPKTGFGVPIQEWLKGPLKTWASDLLSTSTLKRHGVLKPEAVGRYWAEHLSGRGSWHYRLWDVLMLTAWFESNKVRL